MKGNVKIFNLYVALKGPLQSNWEEDEGQELNLLDVGCRK